VRRGKPDNQATLDALRRVESLGQRLAGKPRQPAKTPTAAERLAAIADAPQPPVVVSWWVDPAKDPEHQAQAATLAETARASAAEARAALARSLALETSQAAASRTRAAAEAKAQAAADRLRELRPVYAFLLAAAAILLDTPDGRPPRTATMIAIELWFDGTPPNENQRRALRDGTAPQRVSPAQVAALLNLRRQEGTTTAFDLCRPARRKALREALRTIYLLQQATP
jgi:hypothetical protein